MSKAERSESANLLKAPLNAKVINSGIDGINTRE